MNERTENERKKERRQLWTVKSEFYATPEVKMIYFELLKLQHSMQRRERERVWVGACVLETEGGDGPILFFNL